ncbi:MAG: hypothetical protein H5T69_08055 [Chloroflexi bacterium]|nr:hypothetical protein [Chloroflexota bacterium]
MVRAWLLWWLAITLLGWGTWPIIHILFRHLTGRGLAYARLLGLLLVNYSFWLLGMLGLIPNAGGWLWVMAAGWIVVGSISAIAQRHALGPWLKANWRHTLAIELLFAGTMALYALHKAYDPAINHTEEPMDLLFLNGILASPRLPPRDPWLSGFAISYYYLGYFTVASLARLTGVSAGIAYNLGLAHTLALFVVGGYGVLYDLLGSEGRTHPRRPGLLAAAGALLVAFAANLEPFLELVRAWGVGSAAFYRALGVAGLEGPALGKSWLPQEPWWWWRASRVIQDENPLGKNPTAITEFPAFSFVLGDLHPHVLALPFVIVAFGLVLVLYLHGRRPDIKLGLGELILLPLILGALGFVNSWDLPTYLALWVAAHALGRWQRGEKRLKALRDVLLLGGYLALAGILLYLPFYIGLQSQAQGIRPTYYTKTSLGEFLLCLGGWTLPIVGVAALDWQRLRREQGVPAYELALVWTGIFLLPWAITWLLGGWGRVLIGVLMLFTAGPWVPLLQSGLLAILALELGHAPHSAPERSAGWFVERLALLTGLGLTYLVEFIYLHDAFDTRMNTVFKLYYQAWVLLGIGGVLAMRTLWRAGRGWRFLSLVDGALLIASLYYLPAASYTKAEGYRREPTLDGTAYLERTNPPEYGVLQWLQEHARPGDVLALAPGEEYDASTSRLAAFTGLPTILGWPGHEVQWRGDEAEVRQRLADLETIFTSGDRERVLELLQRYKVTYLLIDPWAIERYKLTDAQVTTLDAFLILRYRNGPYRLYAVPGE